LALSVKETVLQITFVRVPIPELARALSMEYFADLSILFVVDDLARPVLDD
jgi:hypothetical protein